MIEVIRYEAVTFAYPGSGNVALDDVSLAIPEGSFALVLGPSGAGKTTLLRAANGLVPHFTGGSFRGRVLVGERDTREHAPRHLAGVVAYVPQDPAASFVLDKVEDELAYGMENLGVAPSRMRRRVEEVMDLLALAPLRDRSVRSLSGGERQRVAIAAALAAGPRIIVLDEPTSQLDPQGAEDVLASLQRLVHDHGMTVLVAEHRLERVAGFVDLAIGCLDGRTTIGSPAEVIDRFGSGPPVARLGGLLGWRPPPLTVREARQLASGSVALPAVPVEPRRVGELLLRASDLDAAYGQREVLHGVDLPIHAGEIVALMGRNGAGKSTLLRCLAGIHRPSSGAVRFGSEPPRPGVDVALCPQDPEVVLFADTVEEEVSTTLRARKLPGPALDVLRAFGIAHLARRHPRDCSAGERLLVAVAAVAAARAPALLLDEPTRGLDHDSKARLAAFLRSFTALGRAVVIATHDVELAAEVATRVVMIAEGEVIADGSPTYVLGDSHVFAPQMTRVFGAGWLTPEQVASAAVPV